MARTQLTEGHKKNISKGLKESYRNGNRKSWNKDMKGYTNSGSFKKGSIHPKPKIQIDLDYIKKEYINNQKSCYDIAKELDVSEKTIRNRLKEIEVPLRKFNEHTDRTKQKIKQTCIERGIMPSVINKIAWNTGLPVTEKERLRLKQLRSKQIFPKKDTKIEIKIRNFLDELQIEYFQHKYINIQHGYQCDFFIPSKNLVIECDGTYWHHYPIRRDIDNIRTKELWEQGFRVLRLWEFEIVNMDIKDFKDKIKYS